MAAWYPYLGVAAWATGYEIARDPGPFETGAMAAAGWGLSQNQVSAAVMRSVWTETGRAIHQGARAAWQGARAAASWMARTNAARSIGTAVTRTTAAVAIPIVAGYAASYAIGGKSGAADFHDFITGGVSPRKYWDTVTLKSLR